MYTDRICVDSFTPCKATSCLGLLHCKDLLKTILQNLGTKVSLRTYSHSVIARPCAREKMQSTNLLDVPYNGQLSGETLDSSNMPWLCSQEEEH